MHETWADKSQRMVEQALGLKMELRKKDWQSLRLGIYVQLRFWRVFILRSEIVLILG